LHLTFRSGLGDGIGALASQVEGLIRALDLAPGVQRRARGLHGFECGVTYTAGVLLDWTPPDGEGPNKGYASVQIKGDLFKYLGSEESAFLLVFLWECMPYRCTRIDLQMTNCNTPLVPEIIRAFRAGELRVKQKQHFEPKGLELSGGNYPKGATICHGARTSDNYARQYDKHAQELQINPHADPGPPRRRDEVELKGSLAQSVWTELIGVVKESSLTAAPNWEAEARYSQAVIRHQLPIRDTSQWKGTEMPKNWASTAPEPTWWAELFSEEAVRARREKGLPKTFMAKLAYPQQTFGGRFLQQLTLDRLACEGQGHDPDHARWQATLKGRDRFVANARESSLDELLEQIPEELHGRAREIWFEEVRTAADGAENVRDWAETEKTRM
jgi:hypothetical protein